MGNNITLSDLIVTCRVIQLGRIIKLIERLTYVPAVELNYLGKIVGLDQIKLAAMFMLSRHMDLALVGVSRRQDHQSLLPKSSNVLTTIQAMKLKSNGTCHRRLNTRGYEQVDRSHYTSDLSHYSAASSHAAMHESQVKISDHHC